MQSKEEDRNDKQIRDSRKEEGWRKIEEGREEA